MQQFNLELAKQKPNGYRFSLEGGSRFEVRHKKVAAHACNRVASVLATAHYADATGGIRVAVESPAFAGPCASLVGRGHKPPPWPATCPLGRLEHPANSHDRHRRKLPEAKAGLGLSTLALCGWTRGWVEPEGTYTNTERRR